MWSCTQLVLLLELDGWQWESQWTLFCEQWTVEEWVNKRTSEHTRHSLRPHDHRLRAFSQPAGALLLQMMVNAHHHNSGLASWSSSSRAFSALHLTTWQASTCNLHIFLLGLVLFFLALLEARSVYGGLIHTHSPFLRFGAKLPININLLLLQG